MKYKTFLYGHDVPDLIIEDDETWIKIEEEPSLWTGLWPGIAYERLEVVRAKGYDPNRTAADDSRGRRGAAGGRSSNGYAGSYHYLVDEDSILPGDISDLMEKRRWSQDYLFGRDDGIRNFQGWDF